MDNNYKSQLSQILQQAGEIIMSYRNNSKGTTEKDKNEIVTQADIVSNDFIIEKLKSLDANIPIYSEEGSEYKSEAGTRWIVDPLDGTTPWAYGNSGFAISIAFEKEGEIVVGAVYDPVMKELFYAEKGQRATRNDTPIQTVKNVNRTEQLMVVDWGNKDDKRKEGLEYFQKFLSPDMFARKIVPQFAPALGLCHIAEGRIHALICNDTLVEDHSAGSLILREAGGYCTNFYEDNNFEHRTPGIIAANEKSTHEEIINLLKEYIK